MNNNIEKISNAISIISIGLICLFVTLGFFQLSDIWNFFATFWPVFIILGGMKLFFGAFKIGKYLNFILEILFFLALILGLFFYPQIESKFFSSNIENMKMNELEFSIEDDDYDVKKIKNIDLNIEVGAIDFKLDDKANKYLTVKAKYQNNFFEPNIDSSLENETLSIDFTQNINGTLKLRNFTNLGSNIDLSIGQTQIPKNIVIKLGAGKGDISLTDSILSKVEINVGAGDLQLTLPKEYGYIFNSNVGAGKLTIKDQGEIVKNVIGFEGDSIFELGTTPKIPININVGAGKIDIDLR
jgi:hypothetical protein